MLSGLTTCVRLIETGGWLSDDPVRSRLILTNVTNINLVVKQNKEHGTEEKD